MSAKTLLVTIALAVAVVGGCTDSAGSPPPPDAERSDSNVEGPVAGDGVRPLVLVSDFGLGLSAGWREGQADVDDAMALALALASDELEPVAVVTAFGNTVERPQATVALPRFLEAAEADVPVLRGSPRPVPAVPVELNGSEPVDDACLTDGITELAEVLRSFDDVAVAGIAPLSPLACLARNDPDALASITDVVALMGVEPDTALEINGVSVSDFNFGVDVEAARYLLEETELPFTFITFETSSSSLVTTEQLDALGKSDAPLAQLFSESSAAWATSWEETFSEDGIHPWDANTVWWMIEPEAYSCQQTEAAVDIPADSTPGSSIDDTASHLYVGDDVGGREVTACTSYASDATRDAFVDAVVDAMS